MEAGGWRLEGGLGIIKDKGKRLKSRKDRSDARHRHTPLLTRHPGTSA